MYLCQTIMKVIIEPYNPQWLEEFTAAKRHLDAIFKDVQGVSIEHVGSTSVIGMPAKPVIDIDCIVDERNLTQARSALSNAGYTDLGEMNIPGRVAFRQPGYGAADYADGSVARPVDVNDKAACVTPLNLRRNTYILVRDCQAVRNHLDVKRMLKSDAGLRKEYGDLKLRLAQDNTLTNIGDYVTAKNDVLQKILRSAGWSDVELEELRVMNSKPTPLAQQQAADIGVPAAANDLR